MEGFHGYTFFILDVRMLGFYGGREKKIEMQRDRLRWKKDRKKDRRKAIEKESDKKDR